MLLHHQLQTTVARYPDKVALVMEGARYAYTDLSRMADRLAATLQARGVRRGDRIALFMPNSPEMVVAVFATLQTGAIFSPLSPQTKADKLRYILADATPTCLVTDTRLHTAWTGPIQEAAGLHTVVVAGPDAGTLPADSRLLPFAEAVADREVRITDPRTIDQDLAAIIYTSGSTGDPKGVMLTHLNMISAANSITTYLGLCHSDIIMCALPLSFDYGLYQILMGFKVGARLILEPSFAFPVKILEAMQRERVTVFPGVPTMFSLLMTLECLPQFDLSSLRMITNTAAALSERHIRDLRKLFPQARLFSMYGLTECKRVSYLPPEQLDIRPTSVGRGMPNEEVYLVDEHRNHLPPGSIGELVVRGSNVMRGYWRKPEETARRLKPGPYPGEVVLHTGDLFRMDEEGYLYFIGRLDDMIKSRGEKVSPREVENILCAMEGVQEAAVVGVPDALLGEAVKAFIVVKPDYTYSERDVIKHCLAGLESFMAPKYVEFVSSLPRGANGKIDKKSLMKSEERQRRH
jgi:amino acid adenylation domain-containing protein